MNNYLFQLTFTDSGWRELAEHPEDRAEAVRPVAKQRGGDILVSWLSIGEFDFIAIARLPDEEAAMALLAAFKDIGGLREAKYHRLVSWQEGMRVLAEAKIARSPA